MNPLERLAVAAREHSFPFVFVIGTNPVEVERKKF
jgi:hypothetical protein